MAFRHTAMGSKVEHEPEKARKDIERALRKAGGSATLAAAEFGVTRRTFDRWVSRLSKSMGPEERS